MRMQQTAECVDEENWVREEPQLDDYEQLKAEERRGKCTSLTILVLSPLVSPLIHTNCKWCHHPNNHFTDHMQAREKSSKTHGSDHTTIITSFMMVNAVICQNSVSASLVTLSLPSGCIHWCPSLPSFLLFFHQISGLRPDSASCIVHPTSTFATASERETLIDTHTDCSDVAILFSLSPSLQPTLHHQKGYFTTSCQCYFASLCLHHRALASPFLPGKYFALNQWPFGV